MKLMDLSEKDLGKDNVRKLVPPQVKPFRLSNKKMHQKVGETSPQDDPALLLRRDFPNRHRERVQKNSINEKKWNTDKGKEEDPHEPSRAEEKSLPLLSIEWRFITMNKLVYKK
ncbi:MAG: hypothetical protein HKM86_06340 [Deltaproteobacteria bacterium]|nr:hypothetical protein [Deltaproteobacteria bacterium]